MPIWNETLQVIKSRIVLMYILGYLGTAMRNKGY